MFGWILLLLLATSGQSGRVEEKAVDVGDGGRWTVDGDPSRLKWSAVPFAPAHKALLGALGRILFVRFLFHKHRHLLTDFQLPPRSSATQNFLRRGRKLE